MAIRCSIVGCEYDDTHIEREEERRGEEVILTVREFKECARCGNTELISENTGVTSAPRPDGEADAEETADEGSEDPEETIEPEPTTDDPDPEPTTDDPDSPTDPGTADPTTDDAGDSTGPGPASGPEPAEPTAGGSTPGSGTDDAVILDGDAGSTDPTPDPERTSPAAPEPEPATPEATASADPTDAEASTEPGATESPTASADAPESEEQVTDDAVFIDGTGDRTGGLDEAASMDDEPTIASGTTDAEEEYPEDDAIILESSGSDPREGTGVGLDEEEMSGSPSTGGWPEHDDHRGTRTAGGNRTAEAESTRSTSTGKRRSGTGTRTTTGEEASDATGGWPDVDDADEGWDASPDAEDVSEDVEFSGLTPEASGGAVAKERPLSGSSEAVEAGSGSGRQAQQSETASDPSGDLYCAGCGNGVDRESSPHRAGDVCPDCSREYLTER